MGVRPIPVGNAWDYEYDRRIFRNYQHTSVMGVVRIIGSGTQTATPPCLVLDTGTAAANRLVEVGENANKNPNINYLPSNLFTAYYSRIKFSVGIPTLVANPTATMWWGFQLGSFGSSAIFPWDINNLPPVFQIRARADTGNVELIANPGTGVVWTFPIETTGQALVNPWDGLIEFMPGLNVPNSEGRFRIFINGTLVKELKFEDIQDWPDYGQIPECGLGVFASSGSNAAGRLAVPFGPITSEHIPLPL